MKENITTIRLLPETRDRFKEYGKKGESFDTLINRILDEVDSARSKIGEQRGNESALCPA